jgi:hypothetical protein
MGRTGGKTRWYYFFVYGCEHGPERLPTMRMVVGQASDRRCAPSGCEGPARVGKLCWRHYRYLRKKVPADRAKGLGCYRDLPLKIIRLRVALKRDEKQRRKQRQGKARLILFDRGRGFMKMSAARAKVGLCKTRQKQSHLFS